MTRFLGVVAFLLAAAVGFAAIEMEGRLMALDAKRPIGQANVVERFDGPEKVNFHQVPFALEVTLSEGELPGTRVFLNEIAVDSWPIRVGDAWLMRLPVPLLRNGDNLLRLVDGNAEFVERLRIFSLHDGMEDMHFEMAFVDVAAMRKAAPPPHPTQALVDAIHYDLSIRIRHNSTRVDGTLIFTGEVLADGLTSFALDFNPNGGNMQVNFVDQGEGTPTLSRSFSGNFLVMNLPRTYNRGEQLILRVSYGGTPATGGVFGAPFVVSTHGPDATPIVYTFSQPYGARFWWPSKDLPDDKAMLDIRIESDKPYTTVSNGTLISREDRGATEVWHYRADFQIATYLVAICSTNYQYVSGVYTALDSETTMEVGHFLLPQNLDFESPGLAGTINALEFFARTFGEYPFLSHKYTTATHLSGSGMEHTTMTSMPPRDVGIANGSPEPGKGRRNVHELAHHWFGNDVTCATFDHLWLNEGFATWCEALYYEDQYGIDAYHAYVDAWSISTTVPLVHANADNFAGSVSYRRGGMILHMLRNVVGKEELIAGINLFLERHRGQSVLTEDFQSALEASTGQDLSWFFNRWIYLPGRPTYAWSYGLRREGSDNILSVSISQTQTSPMPTVYTMPIDMVLSDLAGNQRIERLWNNARTQTFEVNIGTFDPWTVELDPKRWIFKTEAAANAAAQPTIRSLRNSTLSWTAGTASGFDVITSTDGATWRVLDFPAGAARNLTLGAAAGLEPNRTHWLQLRAQGSGLRPSVLSNAYAYREGPGPRILIVEGYDRWPTQQGRGPNHPWAAWHGVAIGNAGFAFDTADNDWVENGTVSLSDYDAVVWVLGEESTVHETFSPTEQAIVSAYLRGGGKLFVSGAEIGWHLDRPGTVSSRPTDADRAFMANFLKARYVADDSNSYIVSGAPGSVFEGLTFPYDDGTAGIYYADWPDVLQPVNGSTVAMTYTTGSFAGTAAAVQFSGLFPEGTAPGKLVFLGFPFETIHPQENRDAVMKAAFDFFELEPPATASRTDQFLLY